MTLCFNSVPYPRTSWNSVNRATAFLSLVHIFHSADTVFSRTQKRRAQRLVTGDGVLGWSLPNVTCPPSYSAALFSW